MKKSNKFEQLIEHIINEDEAKAKALFHQIVIEKSRDIYESLVDEDQFPVQRGRGAEKLSSEISDHEDTIDGDEHGMHEDEEDFGDEDMGDDMGDEMDADMGDDIDADADMGDDMGEGDIEDRVMDLESAIDELKAEFDQLMAGEENEEENFPGIHDEEGSDDEEAELDADEEVGTEELGDESDVEGSKFGEASVYGESKKTPADLMREYVEKVTAVKPAEGDAVGASSEKVAVNKKSTQISGKNDMGGSSANIARGGSEQAADGKPTPKPSNYATKGQGNLKGADSFENVPGANTKGYKDKKSAKTKEGSDTAGSSAVVKKSLNPGGKPGFKG